MEEISKKDLLLIANLLEYCDALSGERICDDPYPEWLEPYSKEELVSMNTEFHQFNGDPEESYERRGKPLTLNASGYADLFAKRLRRLHEQRGSLFGPNSVYTAAECATLGTRFADIYCEGQLFAREVRRDLAEEFCAEPWKFGNTFAELPRLRTWTMENESCNGAGMNTIKPLDVLAAEAQDNNMGYPK